jgi:predicted dehydrogenase
MINVAIIGFGFMGITHANNILKNKRLNLRAIVTRSEGGIQTKLSELKGNFSTGDIDFSAILSLPVYKTLRECMRYEKIDAVHICVHTDLHYEIATEAIQSGLHVFLEKPMTLRREEGKLMIAFARQRGVKLMVGHVVRFMPAYQKLKEWIDTKALGALKFISLTRFSGLPSWGQWKEKQDDFGSSGGALFDLVIHDIDFLNYAMGCPDEIESVNHPGLLSMHDYIVASWRYKNVIAKVEGGNTFHGTFPFQAGYTARFENASVMYTSLLPTTIQVCTDTHVTHVDAGNPNDGFYNEFDYFADCIESGKDPLLCMPASSLQTIDLCYRHM